MKQALLQNEGTCELEFGINVWLLFECYLILNVIVLGSSTLTCCRFSGLLSLSTRLVAT